jgi:hypothetical protein
MANTITAQNLVVTISEAITLNNQAINSENQLTIANISQVDKRFVSVPTSEITIMSFGAANAAGTFIAANIKYIRITNKDDTNYVRIRVSKSGADTFDTKLEAGKSFIMGNTSESVSATAVSFSTFVDATSISAQANTAAVEIEYFVATI